MKRAKSREAPMVIGPREVARLLKELFAGLRHRRKAKP
jgi:hypothetical protein